MAKKNIENKALKKLVWISLIIIGLSLIITFLIFSNQKNLSTTSGNSTKSFKLSDSKTNPGWKTYTNSGLKFSFDYPDKLSKISDNLPEKYSQDTSNENHLLLQSVDKKSDFTIFLNPKMDGGCWPYYRYTANQSGNRITFEKMLDENYSTNGKGCDTFFTLDLKMSDGNYFIGFYGSDNSKATGDFEKILDSFRFTK